MENPTSVAGNVESFTNDPTPLRPSKSGANQDEKKAENQATGQMSEGQAAGWNQEMADKEKSVSDSSEATDAAVDGEREKSDAV